MPLARYVDRAIELDQNGYGGHPEVFLGLQSEFSLRSGSAERLLADFDSGFPDQCVPFEGGSHLLQALAARGIRTGLITNGSSARQRRKVRKMGLEPLLDVITISEEAGIRKPEPRIFHDTLAKVGVDPEEALFVGNNPWSDIGGARSCGIRAIWMRTPYWPEPPDADAVINSLEEIASLVGEKG